VTMGKVFQEVIERERKGGYLGKNVQMIPDVSNMIKEKFYQTARDENADMVLIEIGGTIGDMENELFIEAARQLKKEVGEHNVLYVHLTYIPIPYGVHEQKSKPTQQSVNMLRQKGIQPDIIIGRCSEIITDKIKEKIATFCDVDKEAVITGLDVDSVYRIPLVFEQESILKIINKKLQVDARPDLRRWVQLIEAMQHPEREVMIAMCGKYTKLEDSYASVVEALYHAGANAGAKVNIKWVETTDIEAGKKKVEDVLKGVQGVIVPGGFGSRGAEGKIQVIRYCRERKVPFLGLCYGMQLAVIEFARNVCKLDGANSTEIVKDAPHPIVDLLPEQRNIGDKGATMRLGGHDVDVEEGTRAFEMFGKKVRLRFRHRLEINPEYVERLQQGNLVFSGKAPDREIMQIMELKDHPFMMATQAHPELTSKLDQPSPFFYGLVKAALTQ